MPNTNVQQLDTDLFLLDLNFQAMPRVVGAYLITGRDGHTLIETGPGSTIAALERAVAAAGVRFADITQLVVTHIHLDHAGASGTLLRRLPAARLFVHPFGAKHMIDPTKLLASATRIYGERMDALWGAFVSCPPERVVTVMDGDEIKCGARTLSALYTPGHAVHHIAYHDAERRTIFTGDVGGVRIPGTPQVRPPTPPPDINVEDWHASVDRLRALEPRALDLTHFGRFDDPGRHLDDLLYRLDDWTKWVAGRLADGFSRDEMATALRLRSDAEMAADDGDRMAAAFELATPAGMTVDGLTRYLRSKS
jgi:glyoxylase-like metal-dependent hydrolase (beta-lactamase superfamily II)